MTLLPLVALLLLPLLALSPSVAADPGTRLRVAWTPAQPRVGDAVVVSVQGAGPDATIEGSLGDLPLRFSARAGAPLALIGLDLDMKPGHHPWQLAVLEPGRPPRTVRGRLKVGARSFSVQHLTLPPSMVDLDPETERRAVAEGDRLRALYATITPERLWRGRFVRPVGGTEPGTGFGARRVINSKPRSPHAGTDYAAPTGTPVLAANGGRVALVGEYFFPGRLVIVDHGLGLYTLYFHLDSVGVREGDVVERAQVVGTVGATGRATGPHLHFGVQVGRARVDPATLLELDVAD